MPQYQARNLAKDIDYDTFFRDTIALVWGDKHSNWPAVKALQPTVDEAARRGILIIDIGDKVGYHTFPNEVIEYDRQLARKTNVVSVAGNHDLRVVKPEEFCQQNKEMHESAEIGALVNDALLTEDNRTFLAQASSMAEARLDSIGLRGVSVVHANYHNPGKYFYLHNEAYLERAADFRREEVAEKEEKKKLDEKAMAGKEKEITASTRQEIAFNCYHVIKSFQRMRQEGVWLCFVGHSHHEGMWQARAGLEQYIDNEKVEFSPEGEIRRLSFDVNDDAMLTNSAPLLKPSFEGGTAIEVPDSGRPEIIGEYPLKRGSMYILNPGSVGQPRDFHPYATFGLLKREGAAGSFKIYKVAYKPSDVVSALFLNSSCINDIIRADLKKMNGRSEREIEDEAKKRTRTFINSIGKRVQRGY